MQHVNDDMDEIFKRAGKDYPLDTSGADWDKIAAGLQTAAPVRKDRDNRKYLFLLLLLPLPWLCMKFTGDKNKSLAGTESIRKVSEEDNGKQQTKTVPALPSQPAGANQHISTGSETIQKEIIPGGPEHQKMILSGLSKKEIRNFHLGSGSHNTASLADTKHRRNAKSSTDNVVKKKWSGSVNIGVTSAVSNVAVIDKGSDNVAVNKNVDITAVTNSDQSTLINNNKKDQKANDLKVIASDPVTVVPDTNTVVSNSTPVTKAAKRPKREEKIYVAAIGGIGITSIKGQKASAAGIDLGVILGYNISPHFAIEAGVLSVKKYYYSNGEYYDRTKIYMPPNSKLTTVTGDCRMIEIPLSLRYNFKSGDKLKWFATAGISNYLMQKENYDYTYYYYTTNYYATYPKSYEKSSKDWAAVMQFSAGYTWKLKSFGLRAEPYVQLPLKGVGYGSLPLTSFGMRVGIQRGFKF